jgi:hypothetical protein
LRYHSVLACRYYLLTWRSLFPFWRGKQKLCGLTRWLESPILVEVLRDEANRALTPGDPVVPPLSMRGIQGNEAAVESIFWAMFPLPCPAYNQRLLRTTSHRAHASRGRRKRNCPMAARGNPKSQLQNRARAWLRLCACARESRSGPAWFERGPIVVFRPGRSSGNRRIA